MIKKPEVNKESKLEKRGLYELLQEARSEEDVKTIYIDFLGLKKLDGFTLGLVDIKTKDIWFEAKDKPTSSYEMFTQLLHYVKQSLDNGDDIPPFLCVVDSAKASLMETANALPLLNNKKIRWGKKASNPDKPLVEDVSQYIGTHFVSYNIKNESTEFKEAIKTAIEQKKIVRTLITPHNLKLVFDNWVERIGTKIRKMDKKIDEKDYTTLFYADIMSDGTNPTYDTLGGEIIHVKGEPAFSLRGEVCKLSSHEGYRSFWNIYEKPPKKEHRKKLLERQDTLIPLEHRKFTGAYYTPLKTVKRAYEYLETYLGKNWQEEYILWDMCCGVGNLELYHEYPRNVFMSTLEQEHIEIMAASKEFTGAHIFQYDYLNDDLDSHGEIDYSITNKMPQELQNILMEGKKKVLVLINPPYAEATAGIAKGEDNKAGVAKTLMTSHMNGWGKASNELFSQFMARFTKEIPNCSVAMFSKLKYVNAPNFEKLREHFKAEFLGGFITHSKAFDGLKGDFPIGFLIWTIDHKTPLKKINLEVIDKNDDEIGEKTFTPYKKAQFLNSWVKRPRANTDKIVPLKNAITVYTGATRVSNWSDEAVAYMALEGGDMQNAGSHTMLLSSVFGANAGGMYINPYNLAQAAIMFTVRKIIKPKWYKDRDQFLVPHTKPSEEFENDCLIYMLFNGSNLTASTNNLEYNGKQYNIVNHFIPFTEAQVEAPSRWESYFMIDYLAGKNNDQAQKEPKPLTFSPEAQEVLNQGKYIWQDYFRQSFTGDIKEEFKLDRPDVGWYQIRKALEKSAKDKSIPSPTDFTPFKDAYSNLTDKIKPQVYTYGFLMD